MVNPLPTMLDEALPRPFCTARVPRWALGVALSMMLVLAACGPVEDGPADEAPPAAERVVPSQARAPLAEATAALRRGAFATALALVDSAERVAPGLPEAAFMRGRTLFELGRLEEAGAAYRTVLARDADYPGAWHNLGNVAFQQKRYRDALAHYREEATRHPAPNPWHGMGGSYESLGRADSARWAYERALEADPSYAPAHASLAAWHQAEGAFEEALLHARRAHELNPDDLDTRYLVGALALQAARNEEAAEVLAAVVEAQPWNYSALYNLGQAHQRLGDAEEARRHLEAASQVRAQQAEVERLEREARGAPGDLRRQLAFAEALRRSGRLEEALAVYHIALVLRPDDLVLRNNVATLYLQQGDTTEALTRYRQVLADDSTFAEAWLNLALYYGRTGQRAAFDRALRQAVRHGQENATVQAFLKRSRQR